MWRYAESSLYADRVKKYISVFGRSNVKITLTEDFIRNTDGVMRGLFDFLEVETDFCADTSKVYNKSGVPKSELVNNLLSRPSKLRTIMKFLVPKPLRSRIRVSLSALNLDKGKMDEKSEAHLISYFYADIIKLEQIIGRRTGWIQDTK